MLHWWWILAGWVPFWFAGFYSHYLAQNWKLEVLQVHNADLQKQVLILRGRVFGKGRQMSGDGNGTTTTDHPTN